MSEQWAHVRVPCWYMSKRKARPTRPCLQNRLCICAQVNREHCAYVACALCCVCVCRARGMWVKSQPGDVALEPTSIHLQCII